MYLVFLTTIVPTSCKTVKNDGPNFYYKPDKRVLYKLRELFNYRPETVLFTLRRIRYVNSFNRVYIRTKSYDCCIRHVPVFVSNVSPSVGPYDRRFK